MTHRGKTAIAAGMLLLFAMAGRVPSALAQEQKKAGFAPKTWDQVVDKGIEYLRTHQSADGTWSKVQSPGITGIALTGLFRSGKVSASDPAAAKALQYVESLVDAKEGHLAGGEKMFHKNYLTSVNLVALKSSGKEKEYATVISNAANYLKKLQHDEGEGKTPKDPFYGGAGYGPGARPDLSNTQFFLDALVEAGTPKDDPVFRKAQVYVSRAQNLQGEYNDQPWAGKINDGSFIYVFGPTPPPGAAGGKQREGATGKRPAAPPEDASRPGYGSMTCAGLKSLLVCGVSREDPRIRKAIEWLRKHYSVDTNPGMPDGGGARGYYYYLVTMAKCLEALGENEFVDASGKKHDWRADITAALTNRQRRDGSWVNETDRWMESNGDLCTAYALIALSYTRPNSK